MVRWALADDAAESSASEDDILQDEAEGVQDAVLDALRGDQDAEEDDDGAGPSTSAPKRKLNIKLKHCGAEDVCHVCRQPGHRAGFVGAVYLDCINKPCYLCGQAGHSTQTCPHRIAPELACTAAADVATAGSLLESLRRREREGSAQRAPPPRARPWHVDAAVLKLHNRRTTCLEFHPTKDNIVLSGDKRGQVAVWDMDKVFERTVLPDINKWLTNALRFLPGEDAACATASYDGCVKIFDVEVGVATRTLVDANPLGWEAVVEEDKLGRWVTFIGLDCSAPAGVVVAGDSKGRVYLLDPRADTPAVVFQAHKKNTKVQSISVHPLEGCLVLSAGNDYQARVLDIRCLGAGLGTEEFGGKGKGKVGASPAEVACFAHPRVINAAYFSPLTGRKIMTTAQDNRLRVWDYWAGAAAAGGGAPDREIVHSHTFNRHLTPFKAEWSPSDASERLVVVGRYISENYEGVALHPVDLIDAGTGALVAELADPNLPTICPVNKPHPRREVIVSGSSRSLYAWRPSDEEADEDGRQAAAEAAVARHGGASTSGGASGGNAVPRGSTNYLFFDADGGGPTKKRTKTTTPSSKTKSKSQTKGGSSSKAPEPEEDEDDSD